MRYCDKLDDYEPHAGLYIKQNKTIEQILVVYADMKKKKTLYICLLSCLFQNVIINDSPLRIHGMSIIRIILYVFNNPDNNTMIFH